MVAKSSSVRTTSAASRATSVPVRPMATPMWASRSAGASFTPSQHKHEGDDREAECKKGSSKPLELEGERRRAGLRFAQKLVFTQAGFVVSNRRDVRHTA